MSQVIRLATNKNMTIAATIAVLPAEPPFFQAIGRLSAGFWAMILGVDRHNERSDEGENRRNHHPRHYQARTHVKALPVGKRFILS
jgi:hypothetical protein